MEHIAALRRRVLPSAPAVAALAAGCLALSAMTLLATIGAPRPPAARAQSDDPPTATLAVAAERWTGRLGTHIWAGRAVDYRGIMTARAPFTATQGTTASLAIEGVVEPPVGLDLTWYDVTADPPSDVGDDWAAWRPREPGSPVEGLSPTLEAQAIALPAQPGRWVLHGIGFWNGEGRGDVGWGWLVDVVDGGAEAFVGTFAGGFERSDFAAGPDACPASGRPGTWWLAAEPETGFFDRYRALMLAETGVGFVEGFPVEVAFRGRLSPPGQHGHLGAYEREVVVTALTAMTTTLRCGMDKPDLALLGATYVQGCERNQLQFTVANLGSRPIAVPIRVVARDAGGGELGVLGLDPLAAGQRVPLLWWWDPPLPEAVPVELVADELPGVDERYRTNNRIAVEHLPPPPCPPPTPEPDGPRLYVPSAERP